MADNKAEELDTAQAEAAAVQPTEVEPEGGANGDADATAEPSLEDVVARLEADLAEAREAALRAQADAINVQRRAEQEIDKARKFALERFTGELLAVVDNLERALQAADQSEHTQAMIEGIELTLKSFLDVLGKYGVEAIEPEGEPFDPQTAQAMTMVENPDVEPNTVIAVMQKGYRLNGRLLRPAMVMVSKAAG